MLDSFVSFFSDLNVADLAYSLVGIFFLIAVIIGIIYTIVDNCIQIRRFILLAFVMFIYYCVLLLLSSVFGEYLLQPFVKCFLDFSEIDERYSITSTDAMTISNTLIFVMPLFILIILLQNQLSERFPDEDEKNRREEALWKNSLFGYTRKVKKLINQGTNVRANRVYNALCAASKFGHTEIVKLLIEADADVNTLDGDGKTALDLASEKGHTEIINLLKRAGAK